MQNLLIAGVPLIARMPLVRHPWRSWLGGDLLRPCLWIRLGPKSVDSRAVEKRQTYIATRDCKTAEFKQSQFERGRIIGLKEAGRHICRSYAAIRRFWQQWAYKDILQRHDGSGRPRATADREDRFIVRLDVTVPDSSLSTIRSATRTQVSTTTIHRRLIERKLRSY
ncbi:HTH_Tnp_Tc3_2 domain-containing protein [Trichonephila clavipes]|nr:HTH_Tnp_Tc3_2 domain-containing protein [Trichonephila clavipes]